MISKDKILLLVNLISSLDESIKELEKAKDSGDHPRFNSLKTNITHIHEEIEKTIQSNKK